MVPEAMDRELILKLKYLVNLAPGEFKVVRDRYAFFPRNEISHEALINALKAESDLKNIRNKEKPIGF